MTWHFVDVACRYRIKCRCPVECIFPESARGPASMGVHGERETIKIFLSLYKVQASIYLLDFQKMEGNPFDFMTLCARIITELKALSQVALALCVLATT
jgi:5'-AMP-activated protein kinase catalytic alpha subunit